LRWLVSEYGYSLCSGVTNVPASGYLTRVVREQFGVPSRFVVLEDWDDGGLLVVDTGEETSPGEHPVYAWIEVGDLEPGQHPPDSARFVSFGAYVEYQLPTMQKRLRS
ncbi:MAG TPA: hypothetical protein VFH26_01405, partial [Gemmatimonadales bacterium]|nr:hypothetical protein [Gemmatimonadales bacterium]